MLRTVRNISPLLFVVLGHLFFLTQGAMLGCGFHSDAADQVPDNQDSPNSYSCNCRCSTSVALNVRVGARFDDVEGPQVIDVDGAGDLDMGKTTVGLRFVNLAIPPGSVITGASVQFTVDQLLEGDNTAPLSLTVFAEAADDAPAFGANVINNLDTLPRTATSIGWNVPPWIVSQSGPAQRTPDLSAVIQEIVNRPGWQSDSALVLLLAGSGGRREAESFDGDPTRAAVLTVQFDVGPVQALNACMPADLNPNLADANGVNHPTPSADQLQADCHGRIEKTFGDLSQACGYPSMCDCNFQANSTRFDVSCNDPCKENPLDPACANFDPKLGNVTATNVAGDTPVCVVARPPANSDGGPSAIAAAVFGRQSEAQVEGPAHIDVSGEEATTQAQGTVELIGDPCPGGDCTVGLAYGLTMNPVTFHVHFASDPTFRDLASTGSSVPNAAVIDPTGTGQVGAKETASSVRGRRDSDTSAFVLTNPDQLDMSVDWTNHTFALSGNMAGDVDDNGDQTLNAAVDLQGEIVNEPPHADAGQDQIAECTSPDGATVRLDGRASSDPEHNDVLFSWSRDSRVGPPAGFGETVEVQQPLGEPTLYVLRVIDAFGQSDEDTTSVGVVDTTAPALALSASPSVLWPPNHKLVSVTVTPTVTDACDDSPVLRLVSITSNEGDLANGAGHTSPDIQDAQFGTDDRQFLLRAERQGGGTGRIYTITYAAEDASGNVTTRQVTVTVPHN